nr:hypothetical protein GZ9C4_37 [uncultured archaeon GZfos9C4]
MKVTGGGINRSKSKFSSVTICLIDGSNLSGTVSPAKALQRIPAEDVPDFCNGDLYIGITNFTFIGGGPPGEFLSVKILQTNLSNEPGVNLHVTGNGLHINMGSGLYLSAPSDGSRQVEYAKGSFSSEEDLGTNVDINSTDDTLMIFINKSAWVRAGIDTSTDAEDVIIEISLNKIVVEEVYNPQDIMLVEDAIQVVEEWIQDLPEDVQSPRGTSQPTTQIFQPIFRRLQFGECN